MMTPKERAAMQQALEALRLAKNSHGIMLMSDPPKDAWRFHDVDLRLVAAITALREALAEQAEQEPVAWMHTFGSDVQINNLPAECYGDHWTRTPLYAAPVRTKDLTDDEIVELWRECDGMSVEDYARAVIAADREKNK